MHAYLVAGGGGLSWVTYKKYMNIKIKSNFMQSSDGIIDGLMEFFGFSFNEVVEMIQHYDLDT